MKKILYVYGIIFGSAFIIAITVFLGNFIRNIWIIEKIFSAKEIYENNNNYRIDREVQKHGEDRNRIIIYNKDNKQRIDTYSWHGMSIHDKWRVDSSIVTTDDSEKLDYKNEIFIDESKVNKKELIKQYLFESIHKNKEGNYYNIVYCEEIENSEYVDYYIYDIDKNNFWIKEYTDCEETTERNKERLFIIESSTTYDVEFDTLTDEDLVEGEVYED